MQPQEIATRTDTGDGTSASAPEPEATAEPTRDAVDFAALKDRVEHDLNLLDEMIELFSTSSSQLLTEMKAAARRRDCETIAHAAHSLKGALLNLCAEPCAQAALELEMLGRQANMAQVERSLPKLQRELGRVQSALATISKHIGGPNSADSDLIDRRA